VRGAQQPGTVELQSAHGSSPTGESTHTGVKRSSNALGDPERCKQATGNGQGRRHPGSQALALFTGALPSV